MARPSEYNFDFLKELKGVDVIYGLYDLNDNLIKYIGYSKNIHERFKNHLYNHESETNIKKYNWINKHKENIRIEILSLAPLDWEAEERRLIIKYSKNNLLNICEGGKNNIHKKQFSEMTCEEHLKDANNALRELNRYYKSKGKSKVFQTFTNNEIDVICSYDINKK
jgi:hypothetical protein